MNQTPITEEWLSDSDFKWQQGERQPSKNWSLICNVVDEVSDWIEPTTISVQRQGWLNAEGDWVGDKDAWMLWITDRFGGRVFIRRIRWTEEIVSLFAVIAGREWDTKTHIYGQAWPAGSKVLDDRRGIQ